MTSLQEQLVQPLLFATGGVPVDLDSTVKKNKNNKIPKWWSAFKHKRLTYKDQLNKNWIQKWIYHGRFPFKFLFHAVLTVACTWLIFLVGDKQGGYAVSARASWCEILLQSNCDNSDYTPGTFFTYSINDTVGIVQTALLNFESIQTNVIGKVEPDPFVRLIVNSYKHCDDIYNPYVKIVDTSTTQVTYRVNSTDMGPLSDSNDIQRFFVCMNSMILKFQLHHVHLSVDSRPMQFLWVIEISFVNAENAARLTVQLTTTRYPAFKGSPFHYVFQTRVVLDILIITVAFISQILHWISIFKSIRIYLAVKRKVHRRSNPLPQTWNTLPMGTKMKFFNLWFLIAIVGSLCSLLGSFLDIFFIWEQDSVSTMIKVIIGLGAGLAWIYILSYLEFNKKYTVLIDALVLGMPSVLRFTVGAIPVYVGFALFGFAAFSESTLRFGSFGEAVVTLFGIQNGDDMQATFRSLDSQLIVSRIYFFIFSIISIYTIANIFIAIMSSAYNYSAKKIHMGDDIVAQDENETKLWTAIMGMDTDSDDSDDNNNGNDGASKKKKSKTRMSSPVANEDVTTGNIGINDGDKGSSTNGIGVEGKVKDADEKEVASEIVMHESYKDISAIVVDAEEKIRGILKNTSKSLKEIEKNNNPDNHVDIDIDADDEGDEDAENKPFIRHNSRKYESSGDFIL